MVSLKDINDLLDKIPLWQKLSKLPERVAVLEKQLEDIAHLQTKRLGDVCRRCGAPALRLHSQRGTHENWQCGECQEYEHRIYEPLKGR